MRQSDSGQMTVEWPERSFTSILELESFVQVKEVAISPGRKMKTVQKPTKKVHICNLFNVPLNSVPHASQAACNILMICSLNTIIYYSYSYILNVMLQFYTGLFTHTLSVQSILNFLEQMKLSACIKVRIVSVLIYSRNRCLLQNTVCNSCLLYTSPSPRDATLSRMPSSA